MKTIEMIDKLTNHTDPAVREAAMQIKVRYVAEWSRMRGFFEGVAEFVDDEGLGERLYAAVDVYVPPVEVANDQTHNQIP
jgi:hypothetical protein